MLKGEKDIWLELSRLITNFLSGELTVEEELKLNEWKEASESNKELLAEITSNAEMKSKLERYRNSDVQKAFESFVQKRKKLQTSSKIRRIWKFCRYAAIFLIFCFSILFYYKGEKRTLPFKITETVGEFKRGNPVLTLSNGSHLIIQDQDLTLNEENGVQINMRSGSEMMYHCADSIHTGLVYNTLTTPAQCDFHFKLADGTKVWLNACSSLRYPVAFTGSERVVYAEGEIYLEVAEDSKHPFFVELNGMKVKVIGTAFNINSYANEEFVEVTLAKGQVAAFVNDKQYDLLPNHQLRMYKENHNVNIKTVNVDDYISWKEGQYVFKGILLSEAAKVLERWYDVAIIFENKNCGNAIYTGVIDKEEPIEVFLQRLCETSTFTSKKEGKIIYVKTI